MTQITDEMIAQNKVERFVSRFESSYHLLACHVALPLVLTPELVNYLRVQFLKSEGVPWIAEADLLLSDLCRPVGYELYVMDEAVRAYLLQELAQNNKFGETRIKEIANFLVGYVKYLEKTNPFLNRKELQRQRWGAMLYVKTEETVQEIAIAISKCVDKSELARLLKITEDFKQEIASSGQFQDFLDYAQLSNDLLRKPETLKREEIKSSYQVAGLELNVPESVKKPQTIPELENFEAFEFEAEVATIIFEPSETDASLYLGLLVSRCEPSASSGAISCFVRKQNQSDIFLLSVSHILAPERQDISIGDPIRIQQGQEEENTVAILSEYNYSVDAAIARIQSGISIQATKLSESKILKGFLTIEQLIDKIQNSSDFPVFKQGKATGLTRGSINAFEMKTTINFRVDDDNNILQRHFENLIALEGEGEQPFSLSGDSGSLVVDEDGYGIGVILGGTKRGGKNNKGITYAISIEHILKALDLELVLDDGIVENKFSHFVCELVTINASGQEFPRQTKYARYFTEYLSNGVDHRARRRLKKLQKDYAQGKINLQDIKQSLSSWEAHLKHGDTWRLRQQIFSTLVFTRT